MELSKKSLDDLISAADKIIEANSSPENNLFGEVQNPEAVREILGISEQNPNLSHELYYANIQKFLGKFLPKGEDITRVIRNLVCILLAHKELSGLTYGIRGADSRMSKTEDMENMIDVLSEWSETPTDYLKLATILLDKCKELGYVPQERRLNDYVPANTNS